MTGMFRFSLATFIAFAMFEDVTRAQPFVTAGSTPAGDYLRGVGIADWGLGQLVLNSAQANSINTDTDIRWNEYLADVAKQQTREYVARKLALATQSKEAYRQNRERILNNPESHDVLSGEALNRVLEELLNLNLGESVFRSERLQVRIPADLVRHIPFKLGEKGEQFSMDRLAAKGKGTWPVALQDRKFDIVKRAYARALDKALEQAIDGKMQNSTIDDLEAKADDLFLKLNEVIPPSNDRFYIEAKERLTELKASVRLLKTAKIEQAIGEIDHYSGTTINDLKIFMMSHDLRFAAAKTPEERLKYPELYASLREQLDKVKVPAGEPIK